MTAATPSSDDDAYILGTDPVELERLRSQHDVWDAELRRFCGEAGVGAGSTVLDLGCGPGFTSLALADLASPGGRVIALDRSRAFLAFLDRERVRVGRPGIETRHGSIEDLDLPEASVDFAFARWLLCWLPDATPGLTRVARCLRPGGALLVQDYLDWGSMRLLPRSAAFDAGVAACLSHWRSTGLNVNVMERLAAVAPGAGLEVSSLRPLARLAPPGSPEWEWIGTFMLGYLPKIVEFDVGAMDAFRAVWEERSRSPYSWLATPTMAEAVLALRG